MIFNLKPSKCPRRRRAWTTEAIRQLGMTTDIETAASIIGIGRTMAYELAKEDQFPVPVRRIRRRALVSVPELLRWLSVEEEPKDRPMP